jgi:hypothetical protein
MRKSPTRRAGTDSQTSRSLRDPLYRRAEYAVRRRRSTRDDGQPAPGRRSPAASATPPGPGSPGARHADHHRRATRPAEVERSNWGGGSLAVRLPNMLRRSGREQRGPSQDVAGVARPPRRHRQSAAVAQQEQAAVGPAPGPVPARARARRHGATPAPVDRTRCDVCAYPNRPSRYHHRKKMENPARAPASRRVTPWAGPRWPAAAWR